MLSIQNRRAYEESKEVIPRSIKQTSDKGMQLEILKNRMFMQSNTRCQEQKVADDANIRPFYDEEPMTEVQLTAECNIFAIGQQHTEQPEIINEGRVDQYPEKCQVKSPILDSSLCGFLPGESYSTLAQAQSMAAEKADISETIVKVFKPHTTVSTEVHQAAETVTKSNELDLLIRSFVRRIFNGENQVVLKSSAVTTTDA
ncbi:hypothetical protein Tco_0417862 [Tanacetum coccineum]